MKLAGVSHFGFIYNWMAIQWLAKPSTLHVRTSFVKTPNHAWRHDDHRDRCFDCRLGAINDDCRNELSAKDRISFSTGTRKSLVRRCFGGRRDVFAAIDQSNQPDAAAVKFYRQRDARTEIANRFVEALLTNDEPP